MKKFLGLFTFIVVVFGINDLTLAASPDLQILAGHVEGMLAGSGEDFHYDNFYLVKEDPRFQFFNLLSLDHVQEPFPIPVAPYNRAAQFGGWLVDPSGNSCMNTRAFVLKRDSATAPVMSANGCTVVSGTWNDPYTGLPHLKAADVQIDHVVALKNAYMTGAHEWNQAKRCLYANYMGNNYHLLSVDGPQNLKKSDYSPARYVPPNKAFVCEFLKDWLNIKLIWTLRITPPEADAIQNLVNSNNCDPAKFVVPAASLTEQRQFMDAHANLCNLPGAEFIKF